MPYLFHLLLHSKEEDAKLNLARHQDILFESSPMMDAFSSFDRILSGTDTEAHVAYFHCSFLKN